MSVDPRRNGQLCSDDPRCYRQCRCSRWPDYKNRFGQYVVPHDEGIGGYAGKVLSYNPVAYWPLWETAGLVAEDLVNSPAQDGAYLGAIAVGMGTSPAGLPCPFFDGANDVVSVLTATLTAAFPTDTGSLILFARMNGAADWTDGNNHELWTFVSPAYGKYMEHKKTTVNNQLRSQHFSNPGNAVHTWLGTGGNVNWFHSAVTWNSTSGNLNSYVDAALTAGPTAGVASWGATDPSFIACIGAASIAGAQSWHGWISDVAVFSYELTVPQITDLMTV